MTPACTTLHDQGYVVLEAVYTAHELDEIRAILHQAWQQAGKPGTGGHFGFVMHPLLRWAPEMAIYYARSPVIELLHELFGEPPRLAHNGGLWSDAARSFTPWHYHRTDSEDASTVWNPRRTQRQERISRVLANAYVDGSNSTLGELLVFPRRVGDPLAPPFLDPYQEWPGQEIVSCEPGSVVVFDQSLFHAARPARVTGYRRLFGGHYTGWSEREVHREDNPAAIPDIRATWREHAGLRALTVPPIA